MSSNYNLGNLAFAKLNMSSAKIAGGTLGVTVGTSSAQCLAQLQNTAEVSFTNPGTNTVYVCQAYDLNGNALVAGANPGSFPILPGATLVFTGNGAAGAWNAASPAGSNPLTIALSQTI
jgi:hypothetical protein